MRFCLDDGTPLSMLANPEPTLVIPPKEVLHTPAAATPLTGTKTHNKLIYLAIGFLALLVGGGVVAFLRSNATTGADSDSQNRRVTESPNTKGTKDNIPTPTPQEMSNRFGPSPTVIAGVAPQNANLKSNDSSNQAKLSYRTYYNSRFDYSISYPAEFLYPQEIAANGDGRKFLSKDSQIVMLVYGEENAQGQTLAQRYQEVAHQNPSTRKVVTYSTLKNNWCVVSGYENEKVFYQKTLNRNGAFLTFRIEYPEVQKTLLDPITTTIAKSFK